MLKDPLGVGWGVMLTLQWVVFWLPTYLASFPRRVERRCHGGNRTADQSIQNWLPLQYHPVV